MRRAPVLILITIIMTTFILNVHNATAISVNYPHIYYAYIEYDADWASDLYDGDVNYAVNTQMYNHINNRNCYYDNQYPFSITTIQPTVAEYFRNRIEYYSKMHIFILQTFLYQRTETYGSTTIRFIGYWFKLANGVEVSPYYLLNLNLDNQLYDNTPLRYIVIASPFGYLMNPSAWAYYLFFMGYPFYPTYHDTFPNDMASLFVMKNVAHVIAFDMAMSYSYDRLLWVIQFFYGLGGGIYMDFAEKFYRILADQGQYVHLGYYPTLDTA